MLVLLNEFDFVVIVNHASISHVLPKLALCTEFQSAAEMVRVFSV